MPQVATFQGKIVSLGGANVIGVNRVPNGLKLIIEDENRIEITNPSGVTLLDFQNASVFTITGHFIYYESEENQVLINRQFTGNGTGAVYGWSLLLTTTGFIAFYLWNGSTANRLYVAWPVPSMLDGTLVHFTLTRSGTGAANINLYFQNELIASKTVLTDLLSGTISYTNALTEIGNRTRMLDPRDLFLSAIIYDLKIAKRAATLGEHTTLFLSDNRKFHEIFGTDNVAEWEFDHNQGFFLQDNSGNGFHGTLKNFENVALGPDNQWVDKNGNGIMPSALILAGATASGEAYTGTTLKAYI